MLAFPWSFSILFAAVMVAVAYVRIHGGIPRAGLAAVLCVLPFTTTGPGPAQMIQGLLVGYIGIRMAALARRSSAGGLGSAIVQAIQLEPLFQPCVIPGPRPMAAIAHGILGTGGCIALLWMGAHVRLWEYGIAGRLADDGVVFLEVAAGAHGLHYLVVGAAGAAGRPVLGLLDRPFRATSLSDFWARRWNRLIQRHLDEGFFRPVLRRGHPMLALFLTFFASGVLHLFCLANAGPPATQLRVGAQIMAFFLAHAAGVAIERALGWHRSPAGPAATRVARARSLAVFLLLSPLLLDPFADIARVHGRRLSPDYPAVLFPTGQVRATPHASLCRTTLYKSAPSAAPAMGASQNTHSCATAQPPT